MMRQKRLSFGLFFVFLLAVVNAFSVKRQPIGRINSLDRSKLDTVADTKFYGRPNFVTHADDAFLDQLTKLYDDLLPDGGVILDIMSSHVSHLPPTKSFKRVDVHGMNAQELQENPARKATQGAVLVRDLNENPSLVGLCVEDAVYDAVLCCVGVQYLQEAESVFADVARVLRPGGTLIISFTNRFFYQKALQGWMDRGMKERARLVRDYLRAAGGYEDIEVRGDGVNVWMQLASLGGFTGDPFVAVVARRSEDA